MHCGSVLVACSNIMRRFLVVFVGPLKDNRLKPKSASCYCASKYHGNIHTMCANGPTYAAVHRRTKENIAKCFLELLERCSTSDIMFCHVLRSSVGNFIFRIETLGDCWVDETGQAIIRQLVSIETASGTKKSPDVKTTVPKPVNMGKNRLGPVKLAEIGRKVHNTLFTCS